MLCNLDLSCNTILTPGGYNNLPNYKKKLMKAPQVINITYTPGLSRKNEFCMYTRIVLVVLTENSVSLTMCVYPTFFYK
jgi:hypothetical protein